MYRLLSGLTLAVLLAGQANAKQNDEDAGNSDFAKVCPRLEATTVFVADQTFGRHKGSASRLSEVHREWQGRGWDFADLEVYVENADLQGFFVTYTRPHPCNGDH